ncbi:hypothetical protein AKO1_004062 [Acrasis kona]|uniref:YitH/HolE acetyltransferase (GNAT) domain-containing protein n=1 Tax=Acrasis kona TaxID=1008807 RepID=A0AAW2YUW8_9EUKA
MTKLLPPYRWLSTTLTTFTSQRIKWLKEHRGNGFGKKLWEFAWNRVVADSRTIGLDGAVAMQEKYKGLGFRESFYSYRYKAHSSSIKEKAASILSDKINIKSGKEVEFEALLTFDTKHVGAPRSKFLLLMLKREDGDSAVALNDQGQITGFTILRKSMDGYRFAQFYADSYDIAQQLFIHLASKVDGNVFIDTPVVEGREDDLHKTFRMDRCGENMRMYQIGTTQQDFCKLPMQNIYGVIWEFG